jgi:hypothetical protein
LQGFLGLTRHYQKFVQNYGKIAATLIALLKKNAFSWNVVVDQAFQALKEAMCTTLVLDFPNFTNIFVLECEASRKGTGVVLMQQGKPLDFTSKPWSSIFIFNISYSFSIG